MQLAVLLPIIAQYGLPVAQQIVTWIESGKTDVTAADLQLLADLGKKKASEYLADAGGAPLAPKSP